MGLSLIKRKQQQDSNDDEEVKQLRKELEDQKQQIAQIQVKMNENNQEFKNFLMFLIHEREGRRENRKEK